jgi:hypothetical protein
MSSAGIFAGSVGAGGGVAEFDGDGTAEADAATLALGTGVGAITVIENVCPEILPRESAANTLNSCAPLVFTTSSRTNDTVSCCPLNFPAFAVSQKMFVPSTMIQIQVAEEFVVLVETVKVTTSSICIVAGGRLRRVIFIVFKLGNPKKTTDVRTRTSPGGSKTFCQE